MDRKERRARVLRILALLTQTIMGGDDFERVSLMTESYSELLKANIQIEKEMAKHGGA